MKFENIYEFSVIGEIKEGKTVYIMDRLNQSILRANDMKVCDLVEILKEAKADESNRFDFWIEKNEQEETEE